MRFVALYLCGLSILVFGLQGIFGTEHFVLDKWIAIYEPWRYVTAIFAHATIGHLLSNLFALGLFGMILEGRIGAKRVLGIFMLSGIIINLLVPYQISLGASGAIYAILGCLILLRPGMIVWLSGMPMPMIIAGIVWLAQDVIGMFIPSNVGHLAHISGLFLGACYALFLRKRFADMPNKPLKLSPDETRIIDEWERRYMMPKKQN